MTSREVANVNGTKSVRSTMCPAQRNPRGHRSGKRSHPVPAVAKTIILIFSKTIARQTSRRMGFAQPRGRSWCETAQGRPHVAASRGTIVRRDVSRETRLEKRIGAGPRRRALEWPSAHIWGEHGCISVMCVYDGEMKGPGSDRSTRRRGTGSRIEDEFSPTRRCCGGSVTCTGRG